MYRKENQATKVTKKRRNKITKNGMNKTQVRSGRKNVKKSQPL